MAERKFTDQDILGTIANPARGINRPSYRNVVEHFGFAADGRPINVVTNLKRTVVITVVDQ
jgi:hypothetical protein